MQTKIDSKVVAFFQKNDPIIAEVLTSNTISFPETKQNHDTYFSQLLRNIVGQQLSVQAASTIWSRFSDYFDNDPTPEAVLQAEDITLRELGLSWSKVKYVTDLAEHVLAQKLPFDKFIDFSDQQIVDQLVQVKGIGVWTAEMFLIFTMGRPDVFSYGDLGLLRGLQKLYQVEDKPAKEDIALIVDRWKPYRSYASIALWESLK